MRVSLGQHQRGLGTGALAPYLSKAEEVALFGSEAILGELFVGLAGCSLCFLHGGVGDAQSTVVGAVFAEGEAAVECHGLAIDFGRDEVAVFVGDASGALLESVGIGLCPPVAEIADGVELTALVVESVGQFVTD